MGQLLSGLGINWTGFLWQLFAFLALILLLWWYLYKPILRVLDARAERIRHSMETAERVQREMAEMEQRSRQMLEDARKQAQQVLSQAHQAAGRIQESAQEEARAQADRIVASAQEEIDKAKTRAMEELRHQVADLAITAASRVVRKELDPQTHYQLINEVLAETPGPSRDGGQPVA